MDTGHGSGAQTAEGQSPGTTRCDWSIRPSDERPAPRIVPRPNDPGSDGSSRGELTRLERGGLVLELERLGTTVVLRLQGDLDLATFGLLEAALEKVDCNVVSVLVIDLHKIEFLDLTGLRSILRANAHCRGQETSVTVVRPLGLARRVFTLTKAHRELDLVTARA